MLSRSRARKSPRSALLRSSVRLGPPSIPSNIAVNHVYRFVSTAGGSTTIIDTDVAGIAGAKCTVVNSVLSLISQVFKIHRISIWTPPASQGASATCSISWYSLISAGPPGPEKSDTTMSTAYPAYVTSTPPPGSRAEMLVSGQGGIALFDLVAPTGSIIDVNVTHYLDDNPATGIVYPVASAVLGEMYYLPLDGASDVYLPVSLQTTT